jgi:hypothetical protein
VPKSNRPITVEYDSGEQVTARPKMRHLVAAEEKFGKGPGGTPPIKGTLYSAWLALDKPDGNFSAWLSRVDGIIVTDEDDEDDEGPTKAAGSDVS